MIPKSKVVTFSYDMKKEWRDLSSANPKKLRFSGLDGIGFSFLIENLCRSKLILASMMCNIQKRLSIDEINYLSSKSRLSYLRVKACVLWNRFFTYVCYLHPGEGKRRMISLGGWHFYFSPLTLLLPIKIIEVSNKIQPYTEKWYSNEVCFKVKRLHKDVLSSLTYLQASIKLVSTYSDSNLNSPFQIQKF